MNGYLKSMGYSQAEIDKMYQNRFQTKTLPGILGTSVGGATPANDILITVTGINNGGVEFVNATGNANGSNNPNFATRAYSYGYCGKSLPKASPQFDMECY